MYCTGCGTALFTGARFCAACGRAADTSSTATAAAPFVAPVALAVAPVRLIETCYAPEWLVTASPGRRLGGFALDWGIAVFTLGLGWLIWFAIVAPRGQTPGKQILRMYIMRADGTRAGGGYTWLRTIVVRGLVTWFLDLMTLGVYTLVASLWCTWDHEHQCVWDKMLDTRVAYAPLGYRPPTVDELARLGQPTPLAARRAGAGPLTPAPRYR